ncbi:MAG: polysaccharide deacetylase family protein [Desulfosporosinus sp.]
MSNTQLVKIISRVPTNKKVITITFDDGPHPVNTMQALNVLKKYGVKATFFVVGSQVEKHPDIAKRLVREDHEIGNHTYTHVNLEEMKTETILEELTKTQEIILKATGHKPVLFRPPYLHYRKNYDAIIKAIHSINCSIILCTYSTGDYRMPGVNSIIQSASKMSNGDILLLHDGGGDRSQTVEALDKIIQSYQQKGFAFVTVSELLKYSPTEIE